MNWQNNITFYTNLVIITFIMFLDMLEILEQNLNKSQDVPQINNLVHRGWQKKERLFYMVLN